MLEQITLTAATTFKIKLTVSVGTLVSKIMQVSD